MNNRLLPRAARVGAFSLAAVLVLGACSASNEDDSGDGGSGDGGSSLTGTLNGAGSSAQEAAMTAWRNGFQEQNQGVTVNYDPVGSGGGREVFVAGGVDFAGSDAYLEGQELKGAEERCSGDVIEMPSYISPIAVIYNLPGVDSLSLSPEALGGIFAGDITSWNDEAITADNPDALLPDTDIVAVHRSDESGTTENFTSYLEEASGGSWSHGTVETWPIQDGEGADGTSGVVQAVEAGEGYIGYADASQAGDLGVAAIGVGDEFVEYSPGAAAAVVDASSPLDGRSDTDLAIEVARDTTESGVYPIVLVSYQIACTSYDDPKKAALVKAFFEYVISEDGQAAAAETAGSAPISDDLRSRAQSALDAIQVG